MSFELVQVTGWDRLRWLKHGFSTRAGGCSAGYGGSSLNLGFTAEDERGAVERNREEFLEAMGGAGALATVRQVHGHAVLAVSTPGAAGEADGMVTDRLGLMIGVLTADCVPVLLVDPVLRAVGAVHAGWRGSAAGIAAAGVKAMRERFGSEPGDLLAAVGPSIGPCCYAVGEELREHFAADLFGAADRLDLWEANRRQLVAAGMRAEQVTVVGECTACAIAAGGERRYFSYRAEGGVTGRMMAVIGVA